MATGGIIIKLCYSLTSRGTLLHLAAAARPPIILRGRAILIFIEKLKKLKKIVSLIARTWSSSRTAREEGIHNITHKAIQLDCSGFRPYKGSGVLGAFRSRSRSFPETLSNSS